MLTTSKEQDIIKERESSPLNHLIIITNNNENKKMSKCSKYKGETINQNITDLLLQKPKIKEKEDRKRRQKKRVSTKKRDSTKKWK